MRGEKNHLRLVGSTSGVAVSVLAPRNAVNVITVHVDNVRAGQVCEILHGGVFALSRRATVPEGRTSITISTFVLAQGRYEVSLRVDGGVESGTDPQTVVVGEQQTAAPSTVRPSLTSRTANAGPRSRHYGRSGQIPAASR